MKKEILEEFKKNKKIMSLYSDYNDREAFNVGILVDYDNDFLLLNSISKYGNYDGILMIYVDDIFRIDSDSKYNNRILDLLSNKQSKKYNFDKYDNCMEKFFNYAIDNEIIVSISLFNSDNKNEIVGKIKSYNDEQIEVYCYDEDGKKDGISFIKTDEINFASLDSEDENMISSLIKD